MSYETEKETRSEPPGPQSIGKTRRSPIGSQISTKRSLPTEAELDTYETWW